MSGLPLENTVVNGMDPPGASGDGRWLNLAAAAAAVERSADDGAGFGAATVSGRETHSGFRAATPATNSEPNALLAPPQPRPTAIVNGNGHYGELENGRSPSKQSQMDDLALRKP